VEHRWQEEGGMMQGGGAMIAKGPTLENHPYRTPPPPTIKGRTVGGGSRMGPQP
jgi:hypothetical protein